MSKFTPSPIIRGMDVVKKYEHQLGKWAVTQLPHFGIYLEVLAQGYISDEFKKEFEESIGEPLLKITYGKLET